MGRNVPVSDTFVRTMRTPFLIALTILALCP